MRTDRDSEQYCPVVALCAIFPDISSLGPVAVTRGLTDTWGLFSGTMLPV